MSFVLRDTLTCTPIGVFNSAARSKFLAPHQATLGTAWEGTIQIEEAYEGCLSDIDGFSHLWVISWFHKNRRWRPRVLPPRGRSVRRGLFATRSPHRPNPIGITAVPLIGREGTTLFIGPSDLIDGTPVLDVKPYLPYADSYPDARTGWIEEDPTPPRFTVQLSPHAEAQLAWLQQEFNVSFFPRAQEILARDPAPHRTRRISRRGTRFQIACGPWRLIYELSALVITIIEVRGGYPARVFSDPAYADLADLHAQQAFAARWG